MILPWGADATGIYISASYITDIPSKENQEFLENMKARFGDDLKTPNDLSVPQYEGVYLYKLAVEKAGTTESRAVIDALDDVSFMGPRGRIRMNKQRHAPLTMYLAQVQADGGIKLISSFVDVDPGEQCPDL